MTKKNDKRLCWNCEGSVSPHISQCPYCGVDVNHPVPKDEQAIFKGYGNPFQSAPKQEIPQPAYTKSQINQGVVTEKEWESVPEIEEENPKKEEAVVKSKQGLFALLLLLPGIVFFLFGIALIFCSTDGVLTLQWNQNVAYFYFLGALPLLYLGWRAL